LPTEPEGDEADGGDLCGKKGIRFGIKDIDDKE